MFLLVSGQVGGWHVSSAELESGIVTCPKPGVGGNRTSCASPHNTGNSVFLVSAFPRFIQLHFNFRSKREINYLKLKKEVNACSS